MEILWTLSMDKVMFNVRKRTLQGGLWIISISTDGLARKIFETSEANIFIRVGMNLIAY